ncbi:MAG: hypothetical protein ACYC59_04670 [Anaerolineaceae bacterium]
MESTKQKYASFIQINLPRVLTQIDRDPDSPTYGCCDRNYWHYKIRDFSSAILQQSGLVLAKLYQVDFPGNPLFQNQQAVDIATATLDFWKKIQLADGSFNEYYPHEHGFPPTAFSFYSACEIYRVLGLEDPSYLKAFAKTAKYLASHIELQASNQEMASITALYSYLLINNDQEIKTAIERKLQHILATQSAEGWFPEYGGADFGYQSVCLDMLAEYYHLSHDERVLEPMERIAAFLKWFIQPDGTIGGEYGARNTTYFLPFGLELLASRGNADAIIMRSILFKNCDQPDYFQHAIDDRYFTHYVLHSFVRAFELPTKKAEIKNRLPYQETGYTYFPESGLLSKTEKTYFVIYSLKKGCVKVFRDKKMVFSDFGYRIDLGKNTIAATNWLDNENQYSFDETENCAITKGRFTKIHVRTSSPISHIGLRLASSLLGNRIIGFLKKKMIFIDKHVEVWFERTVSFQANRITIQDKIHSPEKVTIKSAPPFSLRHVASSKFFSAGDLAERKTVLLENIKNAMIEINYDIETGNTSIFTTGD